MTLFNPKYIITLTAVTSLPYHISRHVNYTTLNGWGTEICHVLAGITAIKKTPRNKMQECNKKLELFWNYKKPFCASSVSSKLSPALFQKSIHVSQTPASSTRGHWRISTGGAEAMPSPTEWLVQGCIFLTTLSFSPHHLHWNHRPNFLLFSSSKTLTWTCPQIWVKFNTGPCGSIGKYYSQCNGLLWSICIKFQGCCLLTQALNFWT